MTFVNLTDTNRTDCQLGTDNQWTTILFSKKLLIKYLFIVLIYYIIVTNLSLADTTY